MDDNIEPSHTELICRLLRQRTNTDEEFGFDAPKASLLIQERDTRHQLLVGARTPPGDQVYLQVVGVEGLYVVHADLLERITALDPPAFGDGALQDGALPLDIPRIWE